MRIWIFVVLCICGGAKADNSWMIMGGTGMDDSLIQSKEITSAKVLGVAWRHKLAQTWEHGLFGFADIYLDAEWHRLNGRHLSGLEKLDILAVKTSFRFFQNQDRTNPLFYEMALGLSHFSDKRFESIRLSSDTQFAIHFGIGWKFDEAGEKDIAFRYNHYSNGYLDQPNPGLDFLTLVYRQSF